MKLKSKLLLVASAALVVSGTAAGTSTFAWYTANRTVNSGISTIGVRVEGTSLAVGIDTSNSDADLAPVNGSGNGSSTGTRLTSTSERAISDISGIGNLNITANTTDTLQTLKPTIHSFVKPYIDSTGTKVAGWYSKDAALAANFYMITYNFVASGTDKVNVFLSHNSTITDTVATPGLSVASNVRFSALSNTIIVPTDAASGIGTDTKANTVDDTPIITASNQKLYADANNTVATDYYETPGNEDPGTSLASINKVLVGDTTSIQALGSTFFSSTGSENSDGSPITANGYLCTLDPTGGDSVPQPGGFASVTFLFWIEGDTTNLGSNSTNFTGSFTADLNFYTAKFPA